MTTPSDEKILELAMCCRNGSLESTRRLLQTFEFSETDFDEKVVVDNDNFWDAAGLALESSSFDVLLLLLENGLNFDRIEDAQHLITTDEAKQFFLFAVNYFKIDDTFSRSLEAYENLSIREAVCADVIQTRDELDLVFQSQKTLPLSEKRL